MEVKKNSQGVFVVHLQQGDVVHDCLLAVAKEHHIQGGMIEGIGGVKDIELGFFDLELHDYNRKLFTADHELICANGNITTLPDGSPHVHLHVGIGNDSFHVFGGHCFHMTIAIEGEFFITPIDPISRSGEDIPGVKAWSLNRCPIR